ncbi:DUF885 domain-containing protein [Leucobacter rhizosphaerae]|uniref:DUF885 domain-containing protein n=1 Tax=Leucobacter rhizosphaerae TaxID=2932245 RepID=A0ABY4FZR7_9MICO|nr:DUF885 domain-containing protein [Leucobacter rhizosphaerae]UOQ61788.1 DUF885 domain-containing protein [Leucobacter rhizosphaerae]
MNRTETPWDIADDFVGELAPHEPTAAQAIGAPIGHGLPDLSPEWCVARYELEGRTLDRLARVETAGLSPAERSLVAAMSERLASDRRLFETGFTPRLVAPLASPAHTVRESFDGVIIDAAHGRAVVERLEAVPETLQQLQRRLIWAAEEGARGTFAGGGVVAERQLEVLAGQIDGWLDPDGMDFFRSMPIAADAPADLVVRARTAQDRASHAYTAFAEFLRGPLRLEAPTNDAVGASVYLATARSFLGADVDLDELSAYGWSELDRLVARATQVAARVLGVAERDETSEPASALLRRAAARLDEDQAGALSDESAIRAWLESRIGDTISALDGAAFDIPPAIHDVVCDVTRAAAGVVYYTPGAPDGSHPARVVWTIPRDETSISTWKEVTSMHHEGVPGHHLEHTINRANVALHPWQRALCEVHGYAEGWAHYSEQLSEELGLLRSDGELLGMLLGQIWRAVRVIADIGLHTGRPVPENRFTTELEWTPELARRMLVELALTSEQTAQFEVDRYLAWPGQALAFKAGQRLWNGLREDAEARGDFDLKTFHHDALSWGPMGLAPLAELLANSGRTSTTDTAKDSI